MEDQDILELFFRRDEAALNETDKKYGRTCRRLALDILRVREDAEECVSDSYLKAWNAIPPTRPLRFAAWLYKVVRNTGISRLRQASGARRGGTDYTAALEELEDCLASPVNLEEKLEAEALAAEIHRFLAALPQGERVIFLARYWLALPTAEIAQKLGCRDGKVRTTLSRTRTKLRQHLEKEGYL